VAAVEEEADDLVLETVGTGRARRSITLKADAEGKIVEMALEAGRRFAAGAVLLRLDDTDQRLALELAEARLAEAGRVFGRLETLETQAFTSTARLTEARTALEIARIERAQAEAALADRTLRAPFAGVAGLPAVEIGDRIDTRTAIASLDDRAEILVGFDLPEAYLGRLETGGLVTARTPAWPNERFEGRIDAIDSRVDPVSRTARVRVALPNAEDRLRPGASFVVTLALPGERHPVVPELALQFSREGPYVWTIREGEARAVAVSLVRRRAGRVLVDGAIAAGEAVAVEGVQRLREGRAVDVINAGDPVLAESAAAADGAPENRP
jgi:RND family efflux transporter MFP subunit